MRIGVIFGGASPEYEVSLRSAHNVVMHMDREKYDVVMIGITKTGRWLEFFGEPAMIADDTWHKDANCVPVIISPCRQHPSSLRLDAAMPIMHGKNGEDGTVQGLLELAGIPIIGCKTLASALGMDKGMARKIAHLAGVNVPKSVVVNGVVDVQLEYPLFVKPVRAGSSLGITVAQSPAQLPRAIEVALEYDERVIVEESVDGFEVGCAILGSGDDIIISVVDEIELKKGFFSFHEKYTLENSVIHVPARIPPEKADEIKKAAGTIYNALGCTGFARVDMFLTPAGSVVFNEVNTIPGLTAGSRFPKMLAATGLPFGQVIDKMIETAVNLTVIPKSDNYADS